MYKIEKITRNKLPVEIVDFINTYPVYRISIDGVIENVISIKPDEINYYLEQRDLFGYDIIPISYIDDDYICLLYSYDNVKVIYWSSELVLEDKALGIFVLFERIEDFLNSCMVSEI